MQIKEQIKKEKELTLVLLEEKVLEVKERLTQINEMIDKNEESKRLMMQVKIMFKDNENRLDNRFANFENGFSDLLIKNLQVKRVVG